MRPDKLVSIVTPSILLDSIAFCEDSFWLNFLVGSDLEDKMQFSWMNQEDDAEVCGACACMSFIL